ncbi:MAG: erythromycin esterase family protein [Rhodothermales bacterium]|nr:erythromycin esterase family protein [Rhodothermales bacterium]
MRQVSITISLISCLSLSCSVDQNSTVIEMDRTTGLSGDGFIELGRAVEDARIVLLGENGHGVAEFSELRSHVLIWLHEEHDFNVVAFESGFFECGHAFNRLTEISARQLLYDCLRYPFQHAELLPLFEYVKESQLTDSPLVLAGVDIQAQGFDSNYRPAFLDSAIVNGDATFESDLKDIDRKLYLVADSGGLGDDRYTWATENLGAISKTYLTAAEMTEGWTRWVFKASTAWAERLASRGRMILEDKPRPAEYFQIRDNWMATLTEAVADSIFGQQKVVLMLHNDHARYGLFRNGEHQIQSAGGLLRNTFGADVFSIGFFMGGGIIADNGRTRHNIDTDSLGSLERFFSAQTSTTGYAVFRNNSNKHIRQFADSVQSYSRMGLYRQTMVPANEFDAVFYINEVRPPEYRIPRDD